MATATTPTAIIRVRRRKRGRGMGASRIIRHRRVGRDGEPGVAGRGPVLVPHRRMIIPLPTPRCADRSCIRLRTVSQQLKAVLVNDAPKSFLPSMKADE